MFIPVLKILRPITKDITDVLSVCAKKKKKDPSLKITSCVFALYS